MINFVSTDDGLSYFAVTEIRAFGIEDDEKGNRRTVIMLNNGVKLYTSRPISEVAEMLGSVNLWH